MFSFIYTPPPTMAEYRADYPNHAVDNKSMKTNLQFYKNEIPSRPRGDTIERIHKTWRDDYDLLESHHGYIQWLFPLKEESRFNHESAVMQRHEAAAIREDPACLARMVTSLRMMLNFWGASLSPEDPRPIPATAFVVRCAEWYNRFTNLRRHGHNNMRISRMLKCLGDVGLEHYKRPIVEFYIMNIWGEIAPLAGSGCADSCKRYWVKTLRNDAEREAMEALIRTLESANWVEAAAEGGGQVLHYDVRDIGKKVAVFRPADSTYYHGRIHGVLAPARVLDQVAIQHIVAYDDDGEKQRHVLGIEGGHPRGREYRLLSLLGPNEGAEGKHEMAEELDDSEKGDAAAGVVVL
jgi:hypothetical protein